MTVSTKAPLTEKRGRFHRRRWLRGLRHVLHHLRAYDCPVTDPGYDFVSGRLWNWFDHVEWAFVIQRSASSLLTCPAGDPPSMFNAADRVRAGEEFVERLKEFRRRQG